MSWNNRIMRRVNKVGDREVILFSLHEVYYTDAGLPKSWTVEPVFGGFESVDDLISSLELMLKDAKRFRDDVLEYDAAPAPNPVPTPEE